jgi:hypothetical protein
MIKCPFCSFDNEEGALFCEQCKSDLSGVEATPAEPVAEAIPLAEAEPVMADVVEANVVEANVVEANVVEAMPVEEAPMAEAVPVEDAPMAEAAPVETIPLAAETAAAPPPPPPPPPAPAAAPPAAPAAAAPAAPAAAALPADAQPRLIVIRGQKLNVEFPIYAGLNFIGRSDEKPVDIDLDDQEPPDRVWCSRQHAVINFEDGKLTLEDLNSANGSYVNRARVHPGDKRPLTVGDVIQIGTVQLKLKV